ncbi:MAG: ATP-binding protein [Betaproteobacteria bacterium]
MKLLRRALLLLLAILLAALLGFLYYKTQGVDFGRQVRVNEHLRNLKVIDAKWNESILRSRSELLGGDELSTLTDEAMGREMQGLGREARALDDPVLVASVASLATQFDRKLKLMAQYRTQSAAFKAGLREVLNMVPITQSRVRDLRGEAPQRATIDDVRARLDRLAAAALEYSSLSAPEPASEIASTRESLLAVAGVLPEEARESLLKTAAALDALVTAKPPRDEMFDRLYYFPTAPRTDSVGAAFAQSFQYQLDERELYRVYLIAYSAALLIFLAYFGMQLFRSYRVINDVNAQLKSANETLEHKVSARTRELSDALIHLKESEAMLVQSEKMSSLGQMVAGVAHEINTPLAYVKSSLESVTAQLPELTTLLGDTEALLQMLQTGDATESQVGAQFARVTAMAQEMRQHEVLDMLQRLVTDGLYGINQISELVSNLKNFSRLDRNKVARFDLKEGLENTLQIARNLVKFKDIRRHYEDIPQVSCSPSQINQVFLNLVTNAAQATPETGGVIRIVTRRVGKDQVAVDVEDNGHGIPPEVLPKIFDPFFTTKDIGKGTGLGLSIAYKIIQQHGGRISVASEVGKGTRFTVQLPVESVVQPVVEAA